MVAEPTRSPLSKWTMPARLDGRSLAMARATWVSLALGLTGLTAVGLMRAFADPQLIVLPPLTDMFTTLGLSFRLMIVVALVVPFLVVVLISGIVFRRRSHDPMALVFTMALLLMYSFGSRGLLTFDATSVLHHSVSIVFAIGMVCLVLVFGLFPDGRFVPPFSAWLVPAATVLFVAFPDGGRLLMALLDGEAGIPTEHGFSCSAGPPCSCPLCRLRFTAIDMCRTSPNVSRPSG